MIAGGIRGGDGKKPRKPTVRTWGVGPEGVEEMVERANSLVWACERWEVRRGRHGAGFEFVDIGLGWLLLSLSGLVLWRNGLMRGYLVVYRRDTFGSRL